MRMKKVLALVLALVIGCSSALLGCTGSSKTKVIVGVDNGFPPMGFLNDQNELGGFDIDVAKVVFELAISSISPRPAVRTRVWRWGLAPVLHWRWPAWHGQQPTWPGGILWPRRT